MTAERQYAIGKCTRDEGAAAFTSGQIAFGVELIVREAHRVARDVEIVGERARRRQARAEAEPAFDDGATEAVVELPMQRCSAGGIDVDQGIRSVRRTSRANVRWHPSPRVVWFFFDFSHVSTVCAPRPAPAASFATKCQESISP